MRALGLLADRMLSVVAPRIGAAAICQGCFSEPCYCSGGFEYNKTCCFVNDPCHVECGSCFRTTTTC